MIDEAKLEEFASEFTWINDSSFNVQHVWSTDRNAIDEEFYFDECLRTVGDSVKIQGFYGASLYYVLSVGDYLYFARKCDIDIESSTALLRRIPVKNVEMVDVDKIKIKS